VYANPFIDKDFRKSAAKVLLIFDICKLNFLFARIKDI